ncbi:MAG: ergothioneine biosynthesis protein EgtB [Pseudomonadota bacterium]|nr:ergothioneine biosynthesis protein EgtB [Pseudomonadota bacterium]
MPPSATPLASAQPPQLRQPSKPALAARFARVRQRSLALAAPLSPEDAMVQSMPDASPAKWHLAHTTWFFERFVLGMQAGHRPFRQEWDYLFNSYYQSVGPFHARDQRGLLSRPTLAEVLDYRRHVDDQVARLLAAGDLDTEALRRITLGTHHEQQHQELLLTDIKHALWCNPLRPAYRDDLPVRRGAASALRWQQAEERVVEIGAAPWPQSDTFAFDSESPRHRVLVPAHALASRPVSNSEYRDFIRDGGYREPSLWMSEGWARIGSQGWTRPLYWDEDLEQEFTLGGMRDIDPHAPVCHLSYLEADAFARWAGARLPTEAEWERAAAPSFAQALAAANLAGDGAALHPQAADGSYEGLQQICGDVWEWTSTAYSPYPGFRTLPGALGEYNGKFMCGQWVLRGGSCATPREHLRPSYRNFFNPPDRWQFSGLRLAKDAA